jgi:hypothetical protein
VEKVREIQDTSKRKIFFFMSLISLFFCKEILDPSKQASAPGTYHDTR